MFKIAFPRVQLNDVPDLFITVETLISSRVSLQKLL